ncbi:MAG: hypothetical protein EA417_14795 [Gammaproteobacteria bacterium]|nr:MAG: hypothetical protein EA417_14795 [Gammaproteobacteria bacterium]
MDDAFARFFDEIGKGLNDPSWFSDNTNRITRPVFGCSWGCPHFTDGFFDQCWGWVDLIGTETVVVENFHPQSQQFVNQLRTMLENGDFSNAAMIALSGRYEDATGAPAFGFGSYRPVPNEAFEGITLEGLSDEQRNRHVLQVFLLTIIRDLLVDNVSIGESHSTLDENVVCDVGEPHCDEATVFCKLKKLPVMKRPPFLTVRKGTCEGPGADPRACSHVSVWGTNTDFDYVGPVEHEVDASARSVVNATVEGHLLHEGTVTRTVKTEGGQIVIETVGAGSGPLPKLNEKMAPMIWEHATDKLKQLFPGACVDDP